MKKIYFRSLSIEITRRCQLKCEHCMRGDAQDLDISNDIIDSFLEQTAGIGRLFFTGGEPTLAPDRMNYIVDHMIEKGIPLGGVSYITNGVELSEEVKAFLAKAHSYITESREKNEIFRSDCKIYFQPRITIALSKDSFHGDNEKVKREYELLLPLDSCFISYKYTGIPIKVGRAKALKYGLSTESTGIGDKVIHPQVGMEYESHHLVCDDSPRSEEMLQFCDAFIPCRLELTAIGKLFSEAAIVGEYVIDDCHNGNAICQFTDGKLPSIFDSVIEYNKGRELCYLPFPMPYTIEDLRTVAEYGNIDTNRPIRPEWPGKYDKIFADDVNNAEWELYVSLQEYQRRYKSYLRRRIEYYTDLEEIKKDFPNSNVHFCKELQDKIKQSSADEVVEWIVSVKDFPWFSIDDAQVELAKFYCNKFIMSDYRKKLDMITKISDNREFRAAANRFLLNSARNQLIK